MLSSLCRGHQADKERTTADFSHLASIFILLQKMRSSSVCYRAGEIDLTNSNADPTIVERIWHILQVAVFILPRLRYPIP